MKNREIIFMQCLICLLLTAFCLTLKYRAAKETVQVSSFGFSKKANDTLTHLAYNLYNGEYND